MRKASNCHALNQTGPCWTTFVLTVLLTSTATHKHSYLNLSREEKAGIWLLTILKDKKTSMNAYSSMMEWHLKEAGRLNQHQTLGDAVGFDHRKVLLESLSKRYNHDGMKPVSKRVRLPSSKAVVNIPCRDAKECIVLLLTDPRIEDEDYLFFSGDPLASPPDQIPILLDLTQGRHI
jgi:hypothetical protein